MRRALIRPLLRCRGESQWRHLSSQPPPGDRLDTRPAADFVPGSVALPPRPAAWRMGLRAAVIASELGAMQWRRARGVPTEARARAMREAFVRLGPAFVKAGQALATRPDAGFPPEVRPK